MENKYNARCRKPPVNKEQLIKAWVNFNGTGTLAIRDSYNVSSVADNGTGDFQIYWDKDFANANYAVVGMVAIDGYFPLTCIFAGLDVGYAKVRCFEIAGTSKDPETACYVAIGDQ